MFVITFFFTAGTTWIILPGKLISDAKQYSWLVCLWAMVYGLAIALLWLFLAKRFPGKNLIEIVTLVLGRWAGGLVALFYILYFTQIASWVTRNLSDFMNISLMPRTPQSVFHVMVLIICAYAVVKGIESIAMVTELLTPYLHFVFWIPVTWGVAREWDWQNFNVPFEFHFLNTFDQTKYLLGFPFMETVSLMMLFPYVHNRLKTSYLLGVFAAGTIMILSVLMPIGSLGVERSAHLVYPIFVLFREMQFTGFLEHLEAILAINILFVVCLKLSIVFYCAVLAICQLFGVKKRSAVAYPLIWFLSAYSLLFENIVMNVEWVDNYLFHYYALYGIVFPVLLLLVAWMRRMNHAPLSGGNRPA